MRTMTFSALLAMMLIPFGLAAAASSPPGQPDAAREGAARSGQQLADAPQGGAGDLSPLQLREVQVLLGEQLQGGGGENLGKIDDMVLDVTTGQVRYVVVSTGGVFGFGDQVYVVPYNALRVDPETMQLALDMTPEQLQNAPRGKNLANRDEAKQIFDYYGVSPYWGEGGPADKNLFE